MRLSAPWTSLVASKGWFFALCILACSLTCTHMQVENKHMYTCTCNFQNNLASITHWVFGISSYYRKLMINQTCLGKWQVTKWLLSCYFSRCCVTMTSSDSLELHFEMVGRGDGFLPGELRLENFWERGLEGSGWRGRSYLCHPNSVTSHVGKLEQFFPDTPNQPHSLQLQSSHMKGS